LSPQILIYYYLYLLYQYKILFSINVGKEYIIVIALIFIKIITINIVFDLTFEN